MFKQKDIYKIDIHYIYINLNIHNPNVEVARGLVCVCVSSYGQKNEINHRVKEVRTRRKFGFCWPWGLV